jgi:HlyD family secretion protein
MMGGMAAVMMAGGGAPGGSPGGPAGGMMTAPGGPAGAGGGMPAGGAMLAGMGGAQQGGPEGGPRQRVMMGGPGGPGGAPSMSPADREKMQAAMAKFLKGRSLQDLTPEERAKMREEIGKAVPGAAGAAAGGGRRRGGGGQGGEDGAAPAMAMTRLGQYSEKDIANAKLPPPVEANNQLDVLLRPGLLADVEIIVEKIPNAINIPAQAVFEKDGQQIVYVRDENRWNERPVKLLKRSESTMVISSGLKPGETIAMADPTVKPGDKKKEKAGASGSPMGGMGGGGK